MNVFVYQGSQCKNIVMQMSKVIYEKGYCLGIMAQTFQKNYLITGPVFNYWSSIDLIWKRCVRCRKLKTASFRTIPWVPEVIFFASEERQRGPKRREKKTSRLPSEPTKRWIFTPAQDGNGPLESGCSSNLVILISQVN